VQSPFHISIVGNGNVGTYLFRQFTEKGFAVDWYSRKGNNETQSFQLLCDNTVSTNLLLLCVNDDAIAEVSEKIKAVDGLVAHTSGAMSLESIAKKHKHRGVFYPLMSIKKDLNLAASKIPFCLEAQHTDDYKLLEKIASQLEAHHYPVDSQQRTYLHLAAVLSHNFSNHLYHQAQEVLEKQQLDFKMLLPLLENAIQKLYNKPAFDLQTGPGIRHDQKTIEKHLSLLDNNMSRDIYKLLTESIQQTHDKKL